MNQKHEGNRQAWNEAAGSYRNTMETSLQLLRDGKSSLCPPEIRFLKDILRKCERCIHLQCAAGTDSLSLLNLGAEEVVGVDISEEMIAIAREKTAMLMYLIGPFLPSAVNSNFQFNDDVSELIDEMYCLATARGPPPN